jgi:hypothetical protein
MTDELLQDLLLRWEELAEAGRPVSAEELCRDCPHLAPELQRRIDGLRDMAWLTGFNGAPRVSRGRPALPLAAGCEVVPGYRLLLWLGKGGFGEVWKARAPDGRPVAVKLVPRMDRGASVEWRAVETIRDIRHPRLLAVYQAWQTEDYLVIALELAERTLLDRWQEERQRGRRGIPAGELLEYLGQAAEGIDYLHERDIQHRDIKPQNLLLSGGGVKVGDFGLARLLAHSVTGHTGVLTTAYAAPEFFHGRTTRHSDQYCLAVAYCQLRGGCLPFAGTPAEIMAGHLEHPPDLTMLPPPERPAAARALAKHSDQRWPSCRAFVAALQEAVQCPGPGDPKSRTVSPVQGPPISSPATVPGGKQSGRWRFLPAKWGRYGVWLAALAVVLGVALFVVRPFLTPLVDECQGEIVPHFELPPGSRLIRSAAAEVYGYPMDRSVALTNGGDRPILWDVPSGKMIWRLPAGAGPCAALAPLDNRIGATGHEDGTVVIWDLERRRRVRTLRGHTNTVQCVAFSSDGQKVLSASCDNTVRLWDRRTGQELRCLKGHTSIVTGVAFNQTGRRALSGSWDGTVRLWDLENGKELKKLDTPENKIWCVSYSQEKEYGLAGGGDNLIRLWDLKSGQEVRRFQGHAGLVYSVSFLGSDRVLSADGHTARIWDLRTGRELFRSPELPSHSQCATPAGIGGRSHILIGTTDHGLQVWRLPE